MWRCLRRTSGSMAGKSAASFDPYTRWWNLSSYPPACPPPWRTTTAPPTFGLFAVLMVLFVLSFNGFGTALRTADVASDALAGLPDSPRSLHGARRIDELGERILFEVRALLRFDEFSLAIVDSERKTLDLRVQERGGEHLPSQPPALDHRPVGRG